MLSNKKSFKYVSVSSNVHQWLNYINYASHIYVALQFCNLNPSFRVFLQDDPEVADLEIE